jgi:hypothetical protein
MKAKNKTTFFKFLCSLGFLSCVCSAAHADLNADLRRNREVESIKGCKGHRDACMNSFGSLKLKPGLVKEVLFRQNAEQPDVTNVFVHLITNRVKKTDMATKDFML